MRNNKKQLRHQNFQNEIWKLLKIESERFDTTYTSHTDDGFYIMIGYARHIMKSSEWAVWVNYTQDKVVFWQPVRNYNGEPKVSDEFIAIFKKYYEEKGYEISYSNDSKFAY